MMKKHFFLQFTFYLLLPFWCTAQSVYTFNHGPYLQELLYDAVTILFTTAREGFSWIELQNPQGEITLCYDTRQGLREAGGTRNAIRIGGLQPDTPYRYRLHSKEITRYQPYQVTFGDSIASEWYTFRTLNPEAEACTFIAMSDMHQHPDRLKQLLKTAGVDSVQFVFYVGDMMNYYDDPEKPYRSFIDPSVQLFATRKPFLYVRGNHETRGASARTFFDCVPKSDGCFYGAYSVGNVMFVMLDCGEDKPDDSSVYAGFADFDSYRSEQAEWFARLIRSKEYKKARWHIVMNHFPPVGDPDSSIPGEEHGLFDIERKFLPLFNKAEIDLMISGHTHRYACMTPENNAKLRFPVFINSTHTAVGASIEGKIMKVRVLDTDGKTVGELTVEK